MAAAAAADASSWRPCRWAAYLGGEESGKNKKQRENGEP
jgi:hypothetical protein